jgi:hypothetical protein
MPARGSADQGTLADPADHGDACATTPLCSAARCPQQTQKAATHSAIGPVTALRERGLRRLRVNIGAGQPVGLGVGLAVQGFS